MAKERMVTRTIIESKKYNVYKLEGTEVKLIEVIETKGKISEKELAKKHKVDKVIVDLIEEVKATYGVPVSDFMEIAVKLDKEENK